MSHLLNRDARVIWHPFTQQGLPQSTLPVVSAHGAFLKLEDGREILDALSSWWVNLHGHAHPQIQAAIADQALTLEHVLFAGCTHEPAVALAEQLTQAEVCRQSQLNWVFYSDNGSTAVEVALKMAYQFHINRADRRDRFLALSHSYHGDTLGAMAVGEPQGFHRLFRPLLPQVDFLDSENLSQLHQWLETRTYAAFIFEPLIQGASGMKTVSATFLDTVIEQCQKKDIVVIADEVFTGFYRTGKCFAIEYLKNKPDLLCLSKGITGGFLPLAATLVNEKIYRGFLSDNWHQAFLHGHSYTANPIACAAGLASWKILHTPECQKNIHSLVQLTEKRVQKVKQQYAPHQARCLGTVGAFERIEQGDYFSKKWKDFKDYALEKNILLRPLGNVVYTVPPYCVTESQLNSIYDVMEDFLTYSV